MRKNGDRSHYGLRMVLCLFAMAYCGKSLFAQQQQQPQQQQPDKSAPAQDSQGQDVKPVALVLPTYSQSIALLGTDQRYMDLSALQARRRTFFMYGMGVSESYDDNFVANLGNRDSSEFLWNAHAALINASNHSSISLQYAPSFVQSTSGASSREVFQNGSISFGEALARDWVMQLSSSNTYGTDFSRLLSPQAFDTSKGVPVSDPSTAVFQFNRGKVFTTADNANFSWHRSASQSVNFSAGESYFTSLDGGPSSNSSFVQASFAAAVSSRTSLSAGGNYYHQTFSHGSCDGYGFSFGISHQVGRHIVLSIAAGPEFETAPCNKGLAGNYEITIAYPLSRRSRIGLTAGRTYTTNYIANTQWSDTAAVSYARQLSEAFNVNVNSGYARSVLAQAGAGTYVGYFAGAELSWKLARTVSLGTAYRRFGQVSGGPRQGQNVALISLGWDPLPARIVK